MDVSEAERPRATMQLPCVSTRASIVSARLPFTLSLSRCLLVSFVPFIIPNQRAPVRHDAKRLINTEHVRLFGYYF